MDTVHLDVAQGSALLDAPAHLSDYRTILDRTEELSLSPSDTRDLVCSIVAEL
ncbi:Scr1 family TA system antitoxin-like transcriptional regulator [Streptomyces cinnamoneus]|uniref:Scr1 family TA system antitoxin-like transcriptional regulator n=1 Tax=Streptomyces cinnamoneus TaxID=53446 RepID=UPI003570F24D